MEFKVLGPVYAINGERRVSLGPTREGTLLAVLALHANETVTADRLIDELWVGAPPPGAASTLPKHVHHLRRLLDPVAKARSASVIETRKTGYALRIPRTALDAWAFEDLAVQARSLRSSGDLSAACQRFGDALTLWHGSPYADFADAAFARAEVTRLTELRLSVIEERIDCELVLGNAATVVAELEALDDAEPLREGLTAKLMLALYRTGRQGHALRVYEHLRRSLADELGIQPGVTVRALEHAILSQSPDLDLVGQVAPSPRSPADTIERLLTATFLFTDLEHSTSLWERRPKEMSDALARHGRMLNEAFVEAGGTVFANTGDGFAVMFTSAVDAITAAVAAQRAHQAQDYGSLGEIRFRVGVHSGEAIRRDGNYFGSPLNVASRLTAAAHGGQILVSESVARLARELLAVDTWLQDLGSWYFDGLSEPERVFQVCHPSLAPGPTHLRAGRPAPRSVPLPAGRLAGRTGEIARVGQMLVESRLVTLTGAGGAGKTRVAIEVASSDGARFPDGVRFVDLASVSDESSVAVRLADALGVRSDHGEGLDWVGQAVAGLRLLVILDNCEHVIAAAAAHAEALAAASPSLRVLATSRVPLRLAIEQVITIDPLPIGSPGRPGAAVDLLVDRARSAGVSLTDETDAIRQIALAVDGLPLAIELLAPRLAHMNPAELVDLLRVDGALAATGRWSRDDATSPLAAAFDWSYRLLDDSAKRLLAAMSVVPGGLTIEGAGHVAEAVGLPLRTTHQLLAELAEQSLVSVDTSSLHTRYRMLQPIRECAALRLADAGGQRDVQVGFASYLADLVDRASSGLLGPDEAHWANVIDEEFDNIRAVVKWSRAPEDVHTGLRIVAKLVAHLLARGRKEIGSWALELTAVKGAEADSLYPVALGLAAMTAMEASRLSDAVSLSSAALDAEARLGTPPSWIPRSVRTLLAAAGQLDADVRTLMHALREVTESGDDLFGSAVALHNRATIISYGANPETGLSTAERLYGMGRAAENPSLLAMGLLTTGWALTRVDAQRAIDDFQEAHRLAASVGNTAIAAMAARGLVQLDPPERDSRLSLATLVPVLQRFVEENDLAQQVSTVLFMIKAFTESGQTEAAAVICAAMEATPWKRSLQLRDAEKALAGCLDDDLMVSARRHGRRLSNAEMVRYAMAEAEKASREAASGVPA